MYKEGFSRGIFYENRETKLLEQGRPQVETDRCRICYRFTPPPPQIKPLTVDGNILPYVLVYQGDEGIRYCRCVSSGEKTARDTMFWGGHFTLRMMRDITKRGTNHAGSLPMYRSFRPTRATATKTGQRLRQSAPPSGTVIHRPVDMTCLYAC